MVSSIEKFDVAVIGAGPAGAVAARKLAEGGAKVVLLERHRMPRYKTCGGGILPMARRNFGVDIGPVIEHTCHRATIQLSPKLHFSIRRDEPLVAMTMRDRLDALLVEQATRAGAIVRDACQLTALRIEAEEVLLATTCGPIRADFVIAADGAAGPTAKLAGFSDARNMAAAVEYEIEVSCEDFERFANVARFDFDAIARGYGWVFPKASHLSIGVGGFRGGASRNLHAIAMDYLERLDIVPRSIERHGFVVPIGIRAKTIARDRIMLTGDSAGLADPITAEGIGNAVRSARFAADAILENPADACATYQRAIDDHLVPEFRWAHRLAWILYDAPRLRDALFARCGNRMANLMMNIVSGETTYAGTMRHWPHYFSLAKYLAARPAAV